MLGFQGFARGIFRTASRCQFSAMGNMKSQHMSWSHKQVTSIMTRALPIPASGLSLINLRQILEKCSENKEIQVENISQGIVLLQASCLDIVGMSLKRMNMTHLKIKCV